MKYVLIFAAVVIFAFLGIAGWIYVTQCGGHNLVC